MPLPYLSMNNQHVCTDNYIRLGCMYSKKTAGARCNDGFAALDGRGKAALRRWGDVIKPTGELCVQSFAYRNTELW